MKSYIVKSDLVYEQYEEWEKQFIQNDEINASAYHDPDSRSVSYYEDLTSFLNKRENSVEGLQRKFVYERSNNPFGIRVKVSDNPNVVFYLKSDQLGFSATKGIYQKYVQNASESLRSKTLRKEALQQISKWIYDSRSIGGAFVWAMDWNGEKWICNPQYNKTRGKKPIQDRADLTLLDIKNCYCNNKDTGIKYGSRLRYQYDTREYTKKWLEHFGTGMDGFRKYIEFFCFDEFMLNENPKDLLTGKEIIDFKDERYKTSLFDYKNEDLSILLSNLHAWITARSNKMEKIMNLPS